MERRVALVTGASRGIGKASALALARAGFDIAAAARTVREGERFEHSPTVKRSDTRPLPGSLETTARLVGELGREALALRLDLLDGASLEAAVDQTLERWGRVDVLVNNAVYTGPGNLDRFLDLPIEMAERIFQANVLAQMRLTQLVLPGMLERERGTIVNLTSAAGLSDPPAPAGAGGWGFAYAASKGAFHRLAGILAVELGSRGIRAHNVEPGFVLTETMELTLKDQGFDARFRGIPPEVPAAVVAWLATAPEAADLNGRTIHAEAFCQEHRLLPDGPTATG